MANGSRFDTFPHWIDNAVKGERFVDEMRHYLPSCPEAIWSVGYFYLSAFVALHVSIDRLSNLRVIIGLGTDDSTAITVERSMEDIKKAIVKELDDDIDSINFDEQGDYFEYIYDMLVSERIKIHVIKKPSHKKVYWLDQFDKPRDIVMHGSANFSILGLGIAYQDNNLQIDSSGATARHYKEEMERDWAESVPFTRDLVDVITRHPKVKKHRGKKGEGDPGDPVPDPDGLVHVKPEEFFKYIINRHKLFHLFDEGKFELRSFQLVDYLTCHDCIANSGAVLLADEAGMGKTVICCRMLQDYYDQEKRFLIIVPPGTTMDQWLEHLDKFGIGFEHGSKIISEGILPYESFSGDDWRGFDLVLVDEAHHFRNAGTARFNNFMSKFKAVNPDAAVVLATATPINNTVLDMVALLKMMENPGKFRATVGPDFDRFKILARKTTLDDSERDEIIAISGRLQRKLVVRTTTRDLRESGETFEINGVPANFQEIIPEQAVYAFTGPVYADMFSRLFPELIDKLQLPHAGLFSSIISMGGTNDDEDDDNGSGSGFQYGFQVTQLYKRFESSIHAFRTSLRNLREREGKLVSMLVDPSIDAKIFRARVIDARVRAKGWETTEKAIDDRNKLVSEGKAIRKDVQERWNDSVPVDATGASVIASSIPDTRAIDGLKTKDIVAAAASDMACIESFERIVDGLQRSPTWHDIHDDKINVLVSRIEGFEPYDKVLVFTQFTATARYVMERLAFAGIPEVEMIHGQMPRDDKDDRVARFCPRYAPKETVKEAMARHGGTLPPEIKVLVATDSMSQSVNLQEARYVINYDLPWNPMIMYQRNGRARRINNPNPVDIINFIPAPEIDASIDLVEKLERKISGIAAVLGLSSKILSKHDDYAIPAGDVKARFAARMETVRTMGTGDAIIASADERPVPELVQRVVKQAGWKVKDVKSVATREKVPYTIIDRAGTDAVLAFHSIDRKGGDDTGSFRRDAVAIEPGTGTVTIDAKAVTVPLVAGRRPLREGEMTIISSFPGTVLPSIVKEVQRAIHRTAASVKADAKANREKNKMLAAINRSPVRVASLRDGPEEKKLKAAIKKIVASIAVRELVTNDALPAIASFSTTWLSGKRGMNASTLQSMLVDIETIDALTSGAGETINTRDLAGTVDGYAVLRKEKNDHPVQNHGSSRWKRQDSILDPRV